MEKQGYTSHQLQQDLLRKDVFDFFYEKDNLERLRKFTLNNEHGKIFAVVFFFVKRFEKNRIVHTGSGLYCITDEYSNALAANTKRFYDFESREGKGDIYWEGQRNPLIQIGVDVFLPLPVLVAMKWFLNMSFDSIFWSRYDDIMDAYVDFTTTVKEKYMNTHRQKLIKMREEAKQTVIKKRETNPLPLKRGSKNVHMTRTERREVAKLLADARKKKSKPKKKPTTGRKPKVKNQFAILTEIEGETIVTE